ncbi:BCCT family transporter [Cellulomonas marina]|uniref:Choline/glycine/proline betaine transport protein n=1 Tax=Cellulomonas marina TaxID=988821 RepID=A0A1I0YI01_9CELL|nr:BCCT family transporter [Cellulomonas marina]GIG28686.1 choline transporter [Cellulomonas marina]SFB12507.1 choline/glycine/proline betaine transport protein [Cellulomonas marina]
MSQTHAAPRPSVARRVFWPAAVLTVSAALAAILAPRAVGGALSAVQGSIVRGFSWYYVLVVAFFVAMSLWFGFGRHGDLRLGRDDDTPEFSTRSWFALLFAAGMGIGLVFYGVSEPLSHFASPRPGVTGTPSELAQQALAQTYLHWGLHAWAIYVVVGLALAYAIHRRGRPVSIRWALEPLLGRRVRGGWGDLVDVVALVGTLFGVATSLGFGVVQISSGLSSIGLLQVSTGLQVVLTGVTTLAVLASVLSGVTRAMKWLSNANLVLAGLLVVVVLVAGPTLFLLRDLVQGIGVYLQNVVGVSFHVTAFRGAAGEAWQASWTSFYWGWWISWAPFVGIFIARISRGRTVRQFVLGVLLVPTLVTFVWFAVLGGTALHREVFGEGGLVGADGTVDLEGALFAVLQTLPAGPALVVGAIVLVALFFVTSSDSGALVMAMIASGGEIEPRRWVRVFFVLVSALLAVALLLSGGLGALQTAAIIIALPFSVVMLLICWATVRAFGREARAYERARRAALVDHIGEYDGLEVEGATVVDVSPADGGRRLPGLRRRLRPARAAVPQAATDDSSAVDDGGRERGATAVPATGAGPSGTA